MLNGVIHEYSVARIVSAIRALVPSEVLRAQYGAIVDLLARVGVTYLNRKVRSVAIGDLDRDGFVDSVTAANRKKPQALPLVPVPVLYQEERPGGVIGDVTGYLEPPSVTDPRVGGG